MFNILLTITTQLILVTAPAFALAQQQPAQGEPARARRGGRGLPQDAAAPQQAARGRSSRRAAQEGEQVLEFFHLQHANCRELESILHNLFDRNTHKFEAETRGNMLIYNGPKSKLESIRSFIKELDRPAAQDGKTTLSMVAIKHRLATEVANQVMQVVNSRELHVAADKGRSMVILSGPANEIENAHSVIAQLDTPTPAATLEFAFFHAFLGGDEPDGPIPADLAEVARELNRFGRLELLGRLSTIVLQDEEFTVQGGVSGNLSASVKGTLLNAAPGDAVKLDLGADLMLERPTPPGGEEKAQRRSRMPIFELRTVVTAKHGDYIVLGSAPAGWTPGESAILVLHVLADPKH